MEKYGEFLFDASSGDIKDCLSDLAIEDIESCCEYRIFERGQAYFTDGMVEHLDLNIKANTVSATVLGTKEYSVEIYIDRGEVHATCTCPYYNVCKHTVAVLLSIESNGIENISENHVDVPPVIESLDFFKEHLGQLSKEELIKLLMKFAPENYVQQIFNSKAGKGDSVKIFAQAEKNIMGFFQDEELLWDPSSMDAALMNQLNHLRGLEDKLPEQIGKLLLTIMMEIEGAFDEGYLYIDNYYAEDFFESPDFNQFVISFAKQLPFGHKLRYIQELNDTLGEMSYNTFEEIPDKYDACFSKEEAGKLTEYVVRNIATINDSFLLNIFDSIKNDLPTNAKEQILGKLTNFGSQKHLVLLAELLIAQNRPGDAFDRLNNFLKGQPGMVDAKIIELYLNTATRINTDLNEAAMLAIEHSKDEKCLSLIKKLGVKDLEAYEQYLRKDYPAELLSFYEKEKRFDDALQLISANKLLNDYSLFPFFAKNKKHIPEQAEQYFMGRIDANLQSTGEKFYVIIAETISQIQKINSTLAGDIVKDIQKNYKRRTKLMGMLKRFAVE